MNQKESDLTTPPDAHFHHVLNNLPEWVLRASPAMRSALKNARPQAPDGHIGASRQHQMSLKSVSEAHWARRNRLEARLSGLKNARDFAQPLLSDALKDRFGVEVDVKTTFLRLYIPRHIPWFGLKSGAARTWTVSLLDAALHNFEASETRADAYEPASTFITQPSPGGQFDTLPAVRRRVSVQDFTGLCRELDIGGQYQTYLKDYLGLTQPVTGAVLKADIVSTHKSAFRVALEQADMWANLPPDALPDLRGHLDSTRLDHQRLRGHDLTLMSSLLTGIVVFAPDLARVRHATPIIAYIPDDPEQPLRHYPDSLAFTKDLTRKLRTPAYQAFFSRFVDHHERTHFFADLTRRLSTVTWHERQHGDPLPSWRDTPIDKPNLQFSLAPIQTELWTHLYQQQVNKLLNDASTLAVSTASVDRAARWARWDALSKIASAIVEVATFAALPFVPFLGEAMLAYMAYQVLDETFEGIVDWAEGLQTEAFVHLMTIAESVVQLGTFAVGSTLAADAFRSLMSSEAVALFSPLKAVETTAGKTRYWAPDLTPYEQSIDLPKTASPDPLGLYHVQGKTLLRLEDRLYSVTPEHDTGRFQIEHPERADAYRPALRHNQHGAWQTPLDQPLTWDRDTVMRRLGHSVEGLSSVEREQILRISGFHEDVLREIHVENQRPPSLLTDTIKRYAINRDLQALTKQPSHPEHFQALNQRLSLFESRYRALEKTDDRRVLLVQGETSGLPTDIAQELVDNASGAEIMQLHNGRVPQRLKDVAVKAMEAVRVARAREGFYLEEMDSPDTHRLALHSLEAMPGWPASLRIEVREFSATGPLRDSVGAKDATLLRTLVHHENGAYQLAGNSEQVDDFYTVLLQALPDTERTALGLSAHDARAFKQHLTVQASEQPQLRGLFARHPQRKPFYDPTTMRLPGGTNGYLRSNRQAFTFDDRIREVYPSLSMEELQSVASDLHRHPQGARTELTRLGNELFQLHRDLEGWVSQAPTVAPETGFALSGPQQQAIRNNRRLFAQEIQRSWRRQTDRDFEAADEPPRYVLRFSEPLPGELPNLTADFGHVSVLELEGVRAVQGIPAFLQHFSGLRRLELRRFALDTLPEAIGQMADLEVVLLIDCAIRIDAAAWSTLSSIRQLKTLDLHANTFEATPGIEAMPELIHLDVSQTGLCAFPSGALHHARLETLMLMDNQISLLPADVFDSPVYEKRGLHLSRNPLDDPARELIKQHYFETSYDLGVVAPQADIDRVTALYPGMEQERASDFVYELPGTLVDGRTELTKLEAEFNRLVSDLATWAGDLPPANPLTGSPYSADQLFIEQASRNEFKQALERCWRHESELDDFNDSLEPMFELRIEQPVAGDLPAIAADFSHVSALEVQSIDGMTRMGRFLESFPNLQSLRLRECHLGNFPDAVFRMVRLRSLSLTGCRVSLSAQTVSALAGMEHLDYLDLSVNPLGHTPDLSQMPGLSTILLNETGITEIPTGLLQLQELDWADLSLNAIAEVPGELMELPVETAENITLRGNPFSEQGLARLIEYYERTRVDFGVEAVIDQGEMEISTSEGSEIEE